ncbi:hypothetical protein Tco_0937795 [Tanacetum coccineum]|uniref:Uncharacterized protein n=1 Tax=Tanacetum coccineum TaxID=301880 RepID=A0ABQ5DFZ1_9ASTR
MYLTTSRPDIMFAVCARARFQVTSKTSHLLEIKRIFRYLKGKPTLGLWYSRDSPFELVTYTDSDYAGATQDRKSTTGGSEYVAAASCCGQVLWIQNQLLDYGYNFMNTVINIDNNNLLTKGFDAGSQAWMEAHVGDEAIHKELGDRMERSATTASSLEAEQDSVKTITEASIRRHLKLEDSDGIPTLPNAEIFEQLALMGYASDSDKLTFQKGHFSPQWRFLIHTILHCLSPKKTA